MASGSGFGQFDGMRKDLLKLVARLTDVINATGPEVLIAKLTQLRDKVTSDGFQVLIVGEFNAGKSTVVNAMLGEKVLPAHGIPTTAVLTVVRWGDQPKADLFEYDQAAVGHIGTKHITVPVSELEQYVTIGAAKGVENKWGLVEAYWPLEIFRLGMEIVDSPGLNESPGHSRITLDYINRADAVAFVISALQALDQTERSLLDDQLRAFTHSNLFCLVNRINQVEDPDEAAEVISYVRTRLRDQWSLGDDRVFFINASGALTGRREGNKQLVDGSGLPEFEESLQHFLITDRARIKIEPPAVQIKTTAQETSIYIDGLVTMLDKDVDVLNAAYEEQRQPLNRLRTERASISGAIENHIQETRLKVQESARRMLVRAAGLCDEWSRDIDPAHKITVNFVHAKKNAEAAIKDVVTALSDRIMRYAGEWQSGELETLLEGRMQDLDDKVGKQLTAFVTGLEDIHAALLNAGDTGQEFVPTTKSRVLGIAGGLLLNPGSLIFGAQFGFKAMLKELLPQLGLVTVLAVLGAGPGFLLTALFGMGAIRALIKLKKVNDKLVATVATSVAGKLREDAADMAMVIADRVHAELDKQHLSIDEQMATGIVAVDQQVQQALRKRDRTQDENDAEKARLAAQRQELADIAKQADVILASWATS
jgi:GTPase SAR1 family protein